VSRTLLSGNEAIARGAWEAGASIGVGYPGTPSTETLESFAASEGVYAEWATNEKVALEVGIGASQAGARALVTMKHVGMNVAADPLLTAAYTGVGGGLVVLVADDPGMHSSQNEQDSRNWGPLARVPILEPSDSREALEFAKQAFDISERFDIPVLIRSTTRLSHAKGLVELGVRTEHERIPYEKNTAKWLMLPGNARGRRLDLDRRVAELESFADESDLNRIEYRDRGIGVVCSAVVYQYVREALPDASVLKLGLSYPLPEKKLREFSGGVERLYVVEEAGDYLARSVRSMGIALEPLPDLPVAGELSPGCIRHAFGLEQCQVRESVGSLPPRPPLMCPGCPHRPVFHAFRQLNAIVSGDIGCYTLGALPPLASMDTCVCMGASIGMAHGIALAEGGEGRPVVAVIGDSTFAHSGIAGLVNTVYNAGSGTVCILDNRITAMTGHQGNPFDGRTAQPGIREGNELEIEALCRAIGVPRVRTVDPHDLAATKTALREEIAAEDLSVIVFRAPCALIVREKSDPYGIDDEACTACGACIKLGCPAIARGDDGKAVIDLAVCVGCGQCVQVCRFSAIERAGAACDIRRPK